MLSVVFGAPVLAPGRPNASRVILARGRFLVKFRNEILACPIRVFAVAASAFPPSPNSAPLAAAVT